MSEHVLEWAPFRLGAGVDESALLPLSERLQTEFLAKQEGFVRRELIRGSDGGYADLVWWKSMALAGAAMEKAAASQVCLAYFGLMSADQNEPGAGVLHFCSLRSY